MPVTADTKGLISFKFNIRNNMIGALKQGAEDIVKLASELAPKDTEALSQSGRVEQISDRVVLISFGNDLPDDRALAQEYGTYEMPAQPYLTPALRAVDVLHYVRVALGLK